VVAIVDTNCDPDEVDWVIPGNDDALRAIRLFTSKIADAVIEGRALATEHDFTADKIVDEKLRPRTCRVFAVCGPRSTPSRSCGKPEPGRASPRPIAAAQGSGIGDRRTGRSRAGESGTRGSPSQSIVARTRKRQERSKTIMEITAALVKATARAHRRGNDGVQEALTEAKGDLAEAEVVLRKRGIASAGKKAGRAPPSRASSAPIFTPAAQLGVLVEVNCESDFVARTDDFRNWFTTSPCTSPPPIRVHAQGRRHPAASKRRRTSARARALAEGQAGEDGRQNRRRPHGQVLRRGLPLRAALRQRKHHSPSIS
jgi:hypothetical protein